jgi:hypothetical protein
VEIIVKADHKEKEKTPLPINFWSRCRQPHCLLVQITHYKKIPAMVKNKRNQNEKQSQIRQKKCINSSFPAG